MNRGGLLLLALLFCGHTLNVDTWITPFCKKISLRDELKFLIPLNMGYDPEPVFDNYLDETVELMKKKTLCGIQTICLSIMQITVPTSDLNVQTLKVRINSFKKIPQDALVILYNFNLVYQRWVLYPLWLLYLYFEDIFAYWQQFNFEQMAKVHQMITDQLTVSMISDCPGHNDFDMTHSNVSYPELSNQIYRHFDQIRRHLATVTGNYNQISANNLLVGTDDFQQAEYLWNGIKSDFGKTIKWGDAFDVLWQKYYEAKHPVTLYNGLQGIKDYQLVYFTLLKMVVLRMIWIHLLLVTDETRREMNDAMHQTVRSFGNITGLNDDAAFADTVKFLKVKSPLPEASKEAIERISSQLTESCLSFSECEVPVIDKDKIPQIFYGLDFVHDYISETDKQRNHKETLYFVKGLKEDGSRFIQNVGYLENRKMVSDLQKNQWIAAYFVKEVKTLLRYFDKDFVESVLKLAYPITENF